MSQPEAATNVEAIRDEWLDRLNQLVENVKTWAESLDWSTRRLDKPMKDMELGRYQAPGLMMQKEFTRILLDPIGHSTPGSEGVVELYLMPALDDIACLYFYDGRWNIYDRLMDLGDGDASPEDADKPLTKATLAEVIERLLQHAS
jgi:hypothetical protein